MKSYLQQLINQARLYFLKIFTPPNNHSSDALSDTSVSIGNRQLNWLLAALLVFGLMNFVAGYFWGQRKAVEYFIKRIEEDSFADRISYALYTMNDRDSGEFEDQDGSDTESSESSTEGSEAEAENDTEGNDSEDEADTEIELVESGKDQQSLLNKSLDKPAKPVLTAKTANFARLAGFGSFKSAQLFLNKIIGIDPKASILERSSRTAKGRKIVWYQVISGEFDDKKDLDRIVQLIKNKEHINEVQIVTQTRDYNANPVNPKKG